MEWNAVLGAWVGISVRFGICGPLSSVVGRSHYLSPRTNTSAHMRTSHFTDRALDFSPAHSTGAYQGSFSHTLRRPALPKAHPLWNCSSRTAPLLTHQ